MEPDVLRLPDALELTRYCVVWLRLASKTVSVSSAADVQQLKQAIEKAGFVVTQ